MSKEDNKQTYELTFAPIPRRTLVVRAYGYVDAEQEARKILNREIYESELENTVRMEG